MFLTMAPLIGLLLLALTLVFIALRYPPYRRITFLLSSGPALALAAYQWPVRNDYVESMVPGFLAMVYAVSSVLILATNLMGAASSIEHSPEGFSRAPMVYIRKDKKGT